MLIGFPRAVLSRDGRGDCKDIPWHNLLPANLGSGASSSDHSLSGGNSSRGDSGSW